MIRQVIFGTPTFEQGKAGLDAASLRQRTIASNLANAVTPGYKAQEVVFEELLTQEQARLPMTTTQPGHLTPKPGPSIPSPVVQARSQEGEGSGVNDVSVEQEMTELTQNTIHFQALSQLLLNNYHGIRDAIRPGT